MNENQANDLKNRTAHIANSERQHQAPKKRTEIEKKKTESETKLWIKGKKRREFAQFTKAIYSHDHWQGMLKHSTEYIELRRGRNEWSRELNDEKYQSWFIVTIHKYENLTGTMMMTTMLIIITTNINAHKIRATDLFETLQIWV